MAPMMDHMLSQRYTVDRRPWLLERLRRFSLVQTVIFL